MTEKKKMGRPISSTKQSVSIYMEKELNKRLQKFAKENAKTKSDVIEEAVTKYLKKWG